MSNLLFEVSPSNFIIHKVENGLKTFSWFFDSSLKSENQKREQITDFLVKEGITLINYDNSLVLWSNKSAVLVPSKLVETSNTESILEFSFGPGINKNESDYNRLPILNSTLIYTIPLWLKSLFVLKFSGTKIIHTSTAILNYLALKNSMNKLCGVVVFNNDFITFSTFFNDKPISFIQTNIETLEDVIYHISYALQNIEINFSSGIIELFHVESEKNGLVNQFIDKLNQLNICQNIKWEHRPDLNLALLSSCG